MVKKESNKLIGILHKKDVYEEIIDECFNRRKQTKSDI